MPAGVSPALSPGSEPTPTVRSCSSDRQAQNKPGAAGGAPGFVRARRGPGARETARCTLAGRGRPQSAQGPAPGGREASRSLGGGGRIGQPGALRTPAPPRPAREEALSPQIHVKIDGFVDERRLKKRARRRSVSQIPLQNRLLGGALRSWGTRPPPPSPSPSASRGGGCGHRVSAEMREGFEGQRGPSHASPGRVGSWRRGVTPSLAAAS